MWPACTTPYRTTPYRAIQYHTIQYRLPYYSRPYLTCLQEQEHRGQGLVKGRGGDSTVCALSSCPKMGTHCWCRVEVQSSDPCKKLSLLEDDGLQ